MNANSLEPVDRLSSLIDATARRDLQAFSRLYSLTSPKLYAIALRILKHATSAEDCLQESYINIWRQASCYQAERAKPMTWMTSIVRNRAIDMLRKQIPMDDSHELLDSLMQTGTRDDAMVDSLSIEKCLSELDAQQRDCVIRSYYEGMTHPELAEIMRLPLGTVKTWIRSGIQKLRMCLQQ